MEIQQETLQDFRKTFKKFDYGGHDHIGRRDMKLVMQGVGMNPTDGEVKTLLDEENCKGDVSFDSFCTMMQKSYRNAGKERERLLSAFEKFDINYDGFISRRDLLRLLTQMGKEPISVEEAEILFDELELDKDGVFNYEDNVVDRLVSNIE